MENRHLNHGLSDETVTELINIFRKFPLIDTVILYGSRAKGSYHQGSDIDLAIFAPDMSDIEFSKLWDALDDLSLIYKIDCLHFEKLKNSSLRDNILKQGVVFFKK